MQTDSGLKHCTDKSGPMPRDWLDAHLQALNQFASTHRFSARCFPEAEGIRATATARAVQAKAIKQTPNSKKTWQKRWTEEAAPMRARPIWATRANSTCAKPVGDGCKNSSSVATPSPSSTTLTLTAPRSLLRWKNQVGAAASVSRKSENSHLAV
jgi:hypothetical protein